MSLNIEHEIRVIGSQNKIRESKKYELPDHGSDIDSNEGRPKQICNC